MFRLTVALAAAVTVLALIGVASADNPHLNSSKPLTLTDNGLTLTASGEVFGLGNGGTVFLSATANATATCTNPSGKNKPPGHNPAPVTVGGQTALPDGQGTNGSRPFSVTTSPPTSPIPPSSPDFACPNTSWTESIVDLAFTSATLTATGTESGSQIFTLASCTLTPIAFPPGTGSVSSSC